MTSKNNKLFILRFLLPGILVLLCIYCYPVLRTIAMSLFDVSSPSAPASQWNWVGLYNYRKLFGSKDFIRAFANSIKYLLLGGLLVITVAIAVLPSLLIYAFSSRKIVFGGMTGGIKG